MTTLSSESPRLFLAPMEGVTDDIFRELITSISPIENSPSNVHYCVSEFIRVTTSLHPKKVFYRYAPELFTDGKTATGVPVLIQLLGGQPEPLAENAERAIELGAQGIDLNFGCPAKTVNRHDGGATLLKCPDRLYQISRAVREAVPLTHSVSAKIRLGFDDPSNLLENVLALTEAKVSWITVHCRTKSQGYRPPADWEWIPRLKEVSNVPLVVNGDIFSVEDFIRCRNITGADAFMIGRGALKNPFLFSQILQSVTSDHSLIPAWQEVQILLEQLHFMAEKKINLNFAAARTKQWLRYLSLAWPEARELFERVKTLRGLEFSTQLKNPDLRDLVLSKAASQEKMKTNVYIKHYF